MLLVIRVIDVGSPFTLVRIVIRLFAARRWGCGRRDGMQDGGVVHGRRLTIVGGVLVMMVRAGDPLMFTEFGSPVLEPHLKNTNVVPFTTDRWRGKASLYTIQQLT